MIASTITAPPENIQIGGGHECFIRSPARALMTDATTNTMKMADMEKGRPSGPRPAMDQPASNDPDTAPMPHMVEKDAVPVTSS